MMLKCEFCKEKGVHFKNMFILVKKGNIYHVQMMLKFQFCKEKAVHFCK